MNISNTIIAYKVIKDLGKKWVEFDAYKLGLIDDKGNRLKSPSSSEEREAYGSYYKVIFNMKRILQRFVGKNPTVQQLTSLFLLSENYSPEQVKMIIESLDLPSDTDTITETQAKVLIESVIE